LRRRLGLIAGPVALCLSDGVAFAQQAARLPDEDGGLLQWAIAAGIAGVVLVTAFLNPKRSHLG
jgi:hypothetical protein